MWGVKQYKAVSPEVTISRIKQLFRDCGIKTREETRTLKDLVYSVRITIVNGKIADLDLGSNGKGMTCEYALASGYAELMERLQTRFLYDNLLMLPPSVLKIFLGTSFFRCAPDETLRLPDWRFFPKQESNANLHCGRTAFAKMESMRTGEVIRVPLELMRFMTGSTGACAGNTRAEAIVQGICEIIERHALQRVFLDAGEGIPTIPTSLLNGLPALKRLNKIAHEQGLSFSVKDCSFGTKMPVLGLLIWNDTSYQFKLGVATSPDAALSRCFTEIFQGYEGNECLLPKDPNMMVATPENFQRAKNNGTGLFPSGIFAEHGESSLDNFKPFEKTDIEGDYQVLTEMLLSAGYEVYVRDCSFLGFPSYYVYIPGLSDIYPQLLDFQGRIDRCMRLTRRAKSERYPSYNVAYSPTRYPPAMYSLAMSLKRKDYATAERCFDSLLGRQLPKTSYNEAVMEFIKLRVNSRHIGFVKKEIGKHWGDAIAEKVLSEFGPNADISAIFKLPTCFKCDVCPTQSRCGLDDLAKLDAIIRCKYCEFFGLKTRGQINANKKGKMK